MEQPPSLVIEELRKHGFLPDPGKTWDWSVVDNDARWIAFAKKADTGNIVLVNVVAVTGKYLVEWYQPRGQFLFDGETPAGV